MNDHPKAPSPEPAAIPKTTKALIDGWANIYSTTPVRPIYLWSSKESAEANIHRTGIHVRFAYLREVSGEGRKVSAGALAWIESNRDFYRGHKVEEYIDELLCALSEEGGRQKEGGNETKAASKSSETLT